MVRRVLGFITIHGEGAGRRAYESAVAAKINELLATASGAHLFAALRAARRPVHIRPFRPRSFGATTGALNALFDREDHSSVRYTGDALPEVYGETNVGCRTVFGPEYRRPPLAFGADGPTAATENAATVFEAQWSDSAATLFHELVHLLRYHMGLKMRADRGAASGGSAFDDRSELAAILFENCYRVEGGLRLRLADGAPSIEPTGADFMQAWRDPRLQPELETIVAEMADFSAKLRELPLRPHPLIPDGGAAGDVFRGAASTW